MNVEDHRNERKYIRHRANLPIEIKLSELVPHKKEFLTNISFGGLSFKSSVPIEKHTVINIKIPLSRPVFSAKGKVVWCKTNPDSTYDIGVQFIGAKDHFKIRMVEQICHIEEYKKEIFEKEGRKLTSVEAALEWIHKYADKFPLEK